MTNLDIIKYLANNNPARLAELLNDIYEIAWEDGSWEQVGENSSIPSFGKWLDEDGSKMGLYCNEELEQWSKTINNPTIEITYPDSLVIELPWEGKDPNHMWNTDNNFNIIGQAIGEIELLENLIECDKYPDSVYSSFRKEVCIGCLDADYCLKSPMSIVECPKFEDSEAKENYQ